MIKKKDKNGFVVIPNDLEVYPERKMWINLVVFDVLNTNDKNFSEFADTHIFIDGQLVSDDVMQRPKVKESLSSVGIDDLVSDELENQMYDNLYFPNINLDCIPDFDLGKYISTPLVASILIGWCDNTLHKESTIWNCTFENLTSDGKEIL